MMKALNATKSKKHDSRVLSDIPAVASFLHQLQKAFLSMDSVLPPGELTRHAQGDRHLLDKLMAQEMQANYAEGAREKDFAVMQPLSPHTPHSTYSPVSARKT
jgi:hypothetical protein